MLGGINSNRDDRIVGGKKRKKKVNSLFGDEDLLAISELEFREAAEKEENEFIHDFEQMIKKFDRILSQLPDS